MVYVINKDGQRLMPTERHGKVRRLLQDKKAKVVRRCPFTIQLLYDTTFIVQEVTLGVDAGSKVIGLSATTKKKVLFEAEVTLRNDIVDLLSIRREMRRSRRNRKTRYRKVRFNNRKKGISLPKKIHRGMKFNDAVFMGIMRWNLYNTLKEIYPDVKLTYGYITKHVRIQHGLRKTHYVDARCISQNAEAISDGIVFYMKKVRCHNRQIHKMTINKGGVCKRNQAPYEVKGFRLYDKVLVNGKEWYIHGRRLNGSFVLKILAGDSLEIVPSKIQFLSTQRGFIVERRTA